MDETTADLRSYYEEEARRGLRKDLRGRRVTERDEFIALVQGESRTSVIDFGAGPGGDVVGFVNAGFRCVGLDLAHGNGLLAAGKGVAVVQASIDTPPIRPASFEAGWCMSTLMHIPEAQVPATLAAMATTLEPEAPLFIGQWGGGLGGDRIDEQIQGERRLFSSRSFDRNAELIEAVGRVERADSWVMGDGPQEYHLFLVRVS